MSEVWLVTLKCFSPVDAFSEIEDPNREVDRALSV